MVNEPANTPCHKCHTFPIPHPDMLNGPAHTPACVRANIESISFLLSWLNEEAGRLPVRLDHRCWACSRSGGFRAISCGGFAGKRHLLLVAFLSADAPAIPLVVELERGPVFSLPAAIPAF